ncbi:MAG: hypothetical protein KKG34_03050, partial [Proteobacteria bacterium]|nr:hypothetical protein [Pseudomonadota bacterium]
GNKTMRTGASASGKVTLFNNPLHLRHHSAGYILRLKTAQGDYWGYEKNIPVTKQYRPDYHYCLSCVRALCQGRY